MHTARALHIQEFWQTNKIKVTECNLFEEDIAYFFVGRPSYKHKTDFTESEYWELPVCFILEFSAVEDIRRVYPFDSGAF